MRKRKRGKPLGSVLCVCGRRKQRRRRYCILCQLHFHVRTVEAHLGKGKGPRPNYKRQKPKEIQKSHGGSGRDALTVGRAGL